MKSVASIVIGICLGIFLITSSSTLDSFSERQCEENRICVFPGDYLEYVNNNSGTVKIVKFGNFVDDEHIEVEWETWGGNKTLETIDTTPSNLSLGTLSTINFLIYSVPFLNSFQEFEFSMEKIIFNGHNRSVLVYDNMKEPHYEIMVDIKTGVVIYMDFMGIIYELSDTNIFSDKVQFSNKEQFSNKGDLSKYENSEYGFSINYPSGWIIEDSQNFEDYGVSFFNKDEWTSTIQVFFYENKYFIAKNIEGLKINEENLCHNSSFETDGWICYDFEIINEMVSEDSDGHEAFMITYYHVNEYGDEAFSVPYPMTGSTMSVIDGNNVWQIISDTDIDEFEFYYEDISNSVASFKILEPPVKKLSITESNKLAFEALQEMMLKDKPKIPSWIKNNAGWWADGAIDDNSFIQGIQYLIKEGIMEIPPTTTQGSSSGTNEIPSWIKNNAGWWADGAIDDNSFIQGIQFLVEKRILNVD